MNKGTLKKIDDLYFNRVWQVVKEIGETERHFNSLESQYRLLSSTWLLSSFVGMGFILKTDATLPVDRWWLILAVCVVSSIGIFMLWRIDLLVYHKLLHSAFMVGTEMESEHKFLPRIRSRMLESQGGTDVTKTIVLFYSVCINLLLAVAFFALIYKNRELGILYMLLIGAGSLLAIIGINYYMISRSRKNLDSDTTQGKFEYKVLPQDHDHLAPDGSEIRQMNGDGHFAHCILPAGKTSRAVKHKTIEEIWYITSGEGEFWNNSGNGEPVHRLSAGTGLTIPAGISFQFRNTGSQPLCILLYSRLPWPGKNEAIPVTGYWE